MRILKVTHRYHFLLQGFKVGVTKVIRVCLPVFPGPLQVVLAAVGSDIHDSEKIHNHILLLVHRNNFKRNGVLNSRGYIARVTGMFCKTCKPTGQTAEKNTFAYGVSMSMFNYLFFLSELMNHNWLFIVFLILMKVIKNNHKAFNLSFMKIYKVIYSFIPQHKQQYSCTTAYTPNIYFRGYKNPLHFELGV